MAILKKEEALERIKQCFEDVTSDQAISLIEDISDTLDAREVTIDTSEVEKLKKELSDNDKMWREKYTQRFFSPTKDELPPEPQKEIEPEVNDISFDDLFTE